MAEAEADLQVPPPPRLTLTRLRPIRPVVAEDRGARERTGGVLDSRNGILFGPCRVRIAAGKQ